MDKPKQFPKNAKRAYKGFNYDVWRWPQKMFDGSVKSFERAVQMPGVSIFASTGKKIIVVKQQQPGTKWYYGVPGGAMDNPKESPKQTALRELLEESGYEPGSFKLWKVFDKPGRLLYTRYIFVASGCKKVSEPNPDGGEKIKVSLVSFEQLLKLTEDPKFFEGDIYYELLRARADKKYAAALKQAIFGAKPNKRR